MGDKLERLELKPTQSLLLDLIRRNGPITRAELSKLSHLTAGAITQQCRELIFLGLVVEGERNMGNRGQPSLPLRLNPGGGCSIGIAFSPGFIGMTIVDLTGKPLVVVSEPHEENLPIDSTLVQIRKMVEQTLKKRQLDNARILGVGYAIPGYLKADGKKRQTVPWLQAWRDIDLQQVFEQNLPLDAWVENNANVSAIGEHYSGEWNKYTDMTFIDMGYGIGAGIISDNKLLKGGFYNAGEVGLGFPAGQPRPSYKYLLSTIQEVGFQESDLEVLMKTRNPVFEQWFDVFSDQVERTVFSCIQWLDPQLIILGGMMPHTIRERLTDCLNKRLKEKLNEDWPVVRIVSSKLGTQSASRGAAMLPLYHVLNQS